MSLNFAEYKDKIGFGKKDLHGLHLHADLEKEKIDVELEIMWFLTLA